MTEILCAQPCNFSLFWQDVFRLGSGRSPASRHSEPRPIHCDHFHSKDSEKGFSLVEALIAMLVLTFGLLSTGQLIYLAMSSTSLARSKGSAAVVGQDKLDFLADLYRQNENATDLTVGAHGPEQVQVLNPTNGLVLNRFNVAWNVIVVPDPRPGKVLRAKQVTVTVTPIVTDGVTVNNKVALNKVVNITSIFSSRAP